jgi:5-methylcytosine-specific restriction endonuclease McrA
MAQDWTTFWRRNAKRKGTHTRKQWLALRDRIGCCVDCGSTGSLTKDHIIPVSRGGCDCIQNIQPLCLQCNSRKSDHIADAIGLQQGC